MSDPLLKGLNLSKERLSISFALLSRPKFRNSWLELNDYFKSGALSLFPNMPVGVPMFSILVGVLHLFSMRFLKLLEVLRLEKLVVLLKAFCCPLEPFKV
jgi:hypothetical protein